MNRSRIALLLCAAALTAAPARAAEMEARIVRVGLFAGSNPIVRAGSWSLVEVELRFLGQGTFDGQLRIDQPDRDGDVATSITPVALATDGEWRPYSVYFVPDSANEASQLRLRLFKADGRQVRLRDETGVEVPEIRGPLVSELRQDDFLIVDLSAPRRLEHVAFLDSDLRKLSGLNARQVRAMTPRELPSRWHALEPVDAIVWDDADPSALLPLQVEALIEWVRAGGRLLLTASKNWQSLANSPLAAALPVTITGISETNEGQEFIPVVKDRAYADKLERLYLKKPFRRCKMTSEPDAIALPSASDLPPIVYRRLLGRGSIVFIGASLRDLMPPPKRYANIDEFSPIDKEPDDDFIRVACERVLARRLLALPPLREDPHETNLTAVGVPDLFDITGRSIAFESVGVSFLIFAVLFAIAYTLAATVGSFWYMKRRSWLHHSWTAFAVVSLVSSAAAGAMVIGLRGFADKLWQTTIIDAHASQDAARATALFGLKTHDHARMDIRLPSGMDADQPEALDCPLRVMPRSGALGAEASRFVASDRYRATLAGTALEDVPIRATLKQFQGQWSGSLGGTLNAKLVMRRQEGRDEIDEGSFIINNLGLDLKRCFLLETSEEVAGEEEKLVLARCLEVGDLPKSGPQSQLQAKELRQLLYFVPGGKDAGAEPKRRERLPLLAEAINTWRGDLGPIGWSGDPDQTDARTFSADQEYAAMLLLSVMNLTRPDGARRLDLTRSIGRSLDCSHQLTRQTAILIGYSDTPPPVVLEVDRVNLKPARSRTIYRFVIPVERKES